MRWEQQQHWAVMRSSTAQVDIVHGKIVPYVPKAKAQPGAEPRAAKAAGKAKLARADSGASSDSEPPPARPPPRRANAAITAEVLYAHFAEARLCYEAPTPADRSGKQGGADTQQVSLCRPWGDSTGAPRGDGGEAPSREEVVTIRDGRADTASPCVLDLRQASSETLWALSKASGADRAFDGCLLQRARLRPVELVP